MANSTNSLSHTKWLKCLKEYSKINNKNFFQGDFMTDYKVGYARVNITPDFPAPMGGYGTSGNRYHDRVLSDVYFTAIAITDNYGKTLMLATADLINCKTEVRDTIAKRLSEELGIDEDYFHLSGTHTHSAPDLYYDDDPKMVEFEQEVINRGVKACKLALSEQKDAEMYVGETKTERLNFVRHFVKDNGEVIGDNYGKKGNSVIVRSTTPVDETLRLIKFVRQNADGSEARDVVIVNWQAHDHLTGAGIKKDMSADWSGAMRSFLESQHNCYAAYFQGCAGNVNPFSRIEEQNRTRNYLEHGRMLAEHINEIYETENLTKMPAGKVVSVRDVYKTPVNHAEEDRMEDALKVTAYRAIHGANKDCRDLAVSLGFHSAYQATAIVNRSKVTDEYIEMPISVYRIGDIGWTACPCEMFDQTGKEIRERSPFKFTITQGYTDAKYSYLPTVAAFEYGCYEADITWYAKGTAEGMRDKLIDMLESIK